MATPLERLQKLNKAQADRIAPRSGQIPGQNFVPEARSGPGSFGPGASRVNAAPGVDTRPTSVDRLDRLNVAQGSVLGNRPRPSGGRPGLKLPSIASLAQGATRNLAEAGNRAGAAVQPLNDLLVPDFQEVGKALATTADIAVGGPPLRLLGEKVPAFRQGAQLLSQLPGALSGSRKPLREDVARLFRGDAALAQQATDTVQPTESGAVTANELAPSAGRGVPGVARAAPRSATNGAGRFLDTVKSNRQTLLDAGGIEVIRGLRGSIDTPADSEFGHQSFSEDLFGPGGFEGDERLKNAGGNFPLAGAIETGRASDVRSAAQVNAARISANAKIATAGAAGGKGAQEGTLEARREELQRLAVALNDLPDSPAKAAQLLQVTTAIKGLNTIAQQANNFGLANDPVQLNTQ